MVVMRRVALWIACALFVVSCGGDVALNVAEPVVAKEPLASSPTRLVDAPEGSPLIDKRTQYQGFGTLTPASQADSETLVALASGEIEVFASADASEAQFTMPWTTILGTVTVLAVVDQPSAEWVEVMLPIRPNDATGFVRTADVEVYVANGKILVDLSDRKLTYTLDGNEVVSTTVAIGQPANPTPTGSFFVTDSVTLANPNSPWGPHALGLSARSDTITEYNGGDGIIGIHGTSNPSSIGRAASLGCVRLPNEMITLLHGIVPIGTLVEIRA